MINGDTPNPLQQNGMQPWQTSPRALFHAWEEDRFNNTSFKEASEIQVPQKDNLSGTNTWLQPGGYGSGQLIEAMKAKRERDNTGEFKEKTKLDGEHDQHKTRQPPSPHPRTAWGTREH